MKLDNILTEARTRTSALTESYPAAITWRALRLHGWLFALWLAVMISIPITLWVWGEEVLRWGVTISVMLQAAAVLATLATVWPLARLLRLLLVVIPAAWLVERVGSTTGWPFGDYHYTDRLVPQLGGVPVIIPFAWLMMLPPAWAVARKIVGDSAHNGSGWRFALVSGLAFMAWDLFLDPQMVGWGYWEWTEPEMWLGGYFGIPWINFGGWALSAALITLLVTRVVRMDPLPVPMLLAIYVATWLLETGGQAVIWGLPGSALVGFVGMGVFVGLALRRRVADG